MPRILSLAHLVSLPLLAIVSLPALNARGHSFVIRGWLSDESCASGRASSGTYTGTNPECAKKCVHEGKRIVLVDPDQKRLLIIVNRDIAVERVGDYVEISGDLDEQARTLHIDSLKLLEKAAQCVMCRPKKRPSSGRNLRIFTRLVSVLANSCVVDNRKLEIYMEGTDLSPAWNSHVQECKLTPINQSLLTTAIGSRT